MRNSSRQKVLTIITIVSLGFGVETASASTSFGAWYLNPINPTEAIADFGNNDINGLFEDHIPFNLPVGYSGFGGDSVIVGFAGSFDLTFSEFSLWDLTDNTLIATDDGFTDLSQWFKFSGPLPQSHSYELVLKGNLLDGYTNGSYVGDLTISAAIPEPETYAMLLAGLGLLGIRLTAEKKTFDLV